MAETQYRRLTWPRRRKGTVSVVTYSRSSLWLGNDHLLVIVSNGYSETYKRFYFQDIQTIAIRLTSRRLIWNWVLGVPIAIFLLRSAYELSIHHNPDLLDIVISVLRILIPGVPLLINNLLGPTCACTLRTAVQTEQLPSLCRLPKTRRILNLLRPHIAQAQGQFAPDEIPARLQAWQASGTAAAPSDPAVAIASPVTTRLQGENATAESNALEEAPPIIARLNGGDNTAQANALGEMPPHTLEP
jgi:hypothetical protein